MTDLYCPQCGTLIPEGKKICPECSFDLEEFDKEAESEFNALLNAANKKLSEESDEEGSAPESAGAAPSGAVTQEMIDAMMNGGQASTPIPAPAAPPSGGASGQVTQDMIDAMMNGTQDFPPADAAPAAAQAAAQAEAPAGDSGGKPAKKQKPPKEPKKPKEPKAPKAPKAPREPKAQKQPKPAKEKAAKEGSGGKRSLMPFLITVIAVIVAAALGFCTSLLFFTDFIHTAEEDFAIKSANAVNSKLNINERLCIYKAYVKNASAADECLLYAVVDYSDTVTVTRYRVVVSRDNPNVINIYYPVDETSQAYIDMKNSDDPETRIQASVLKNYSDTIDAANREILMGSETWKPVDITRINSAITSGQTRKTGSSAGKGA